MEHLKPLMRRLAFLKNRSVAGLDIIDCGVWTIAIRKEPRSLLPKFPTLENAKELLGHLLPTWTFIKDIYRIAPRQLIIYVLHKGWTSLEGGLSLYISGRLTNATLNFLQGHGESSRKDILYALLARSALIIVREISNKLTFHDLQIFKDRVRLHFIQKAIYQELAGLDDNTLDNIDTSLASGPMGPQPFFSGSAPDAWFTFESLSVTLTSITSCFSQMYFGFALVKQYNFDPVYIAITLAKPYVIFMVPDYFNKEYLIYCRNEAYKRLVALQQMTFNTMYRTDLQSDGVGNYVINEFNRCREEVGDEHTSHVSEQWFGYKSFLKSTITDIISSFSTDYFVLKAVFRPGSLTLNSYMILQQTSQNIAFTVYMLTQELKITASRLEAISMHYPELFPVEETTVEGTVVMTPTEKLVTTVEPALPSDTPQKGMQVEFRNVSFVYPGTEKKALDNVSFVIKPGHLVAIVGVNGSGKSTITNMINRLYDPESGEVLIDNIPIKESNLADVRRSMAILRQNHAMYPLSLRENVALGLPDQDVSDEEVESALRDGGAYGFVQKLPDGVETNLKPVGVRETTDLSIGEELKIKEEVWTNLSGGESQRLAASRAFLRLKGGKVRFIAADEPSSALDPEGEHDLFARLREYRGETTVVFITHRFGHVTKHADLILCMKDGFLVEQGTHDELMEKGGEYHKLHSVQARAF